MSSQLALPFVSLVGASASTPPDACPEVRRPSRRAARLKLPLVETASALPKPGADDDETRRLDLNEHLVRNPAASFLFEVRGDAMAEAGIFDGDMLVVDQDIPPAHGHIVLALVNGERLVRRLHHRGRRTALLASGDSPEFVPEDGSELTIWGVVTARFARLL